MFEGTAQGARFSDCGTYRYTLWRMWDDSEKTVVFVCLNPSTADAELDDPTLRRCIGFAKSWGFGSVIIVNLFAYRSTDPNILRQIHDPIGSENSFWLTRAWTMSSLAIAAWGNRGGLLDRDYAVRQIMPYLKCLAINKTGQPKHPLYVRGDIALSDLKEFPQ